MIRPPRLRPVALFAALTALASASAACESHSCDLSPQTTAVATVTHTETGAPICDARVFVVRGGFETDFHLAPTGGPGGACLYEVGGFYGSFQIAVTHPDFHSESRKVSVPDHFCHDTPARADFRLTPLR